jgi:triphosphoribosyl-dephospho-CoA synthase
VEPAAQAQYCARLAIGSLHAELLLYPKPGLVSPVDNGSHTDMSAATFMLSLFSLRHYFAAITSAGAAGAPLAALRRLGIAAEVRMLAATGGVNTHRGAIFSIGLLCAAYGKAAQTGPIGAATLRAVLLNSWGEQLASYARASAVGDPPSHGLLMAQRHATGGAREQAAHGLPAVFEVGVPALRQALAAGRTLEQARIDALFALMAAVSDTNVLYRGGAEGARFVRDSARAFVDAGGTGAPDWRTKAVDLHHAFVARRLSPGGAADLLAASCLVHGLCAE